MIALAAFLAAVLAGLTPVILRRIPEPINASREKIPYSQLAQTRYLAVVCAVVAAGCAALITFRADAYAPVAAWVVLCAVGVMLAFIDLRTRLLPFVIVVPTTLTVCALLAVAAFLDRDWESLMRSLGCGAGVWLFYRMSWQFTRRAIGYGDVRLSFLIGSVLGYVSIEAMVVGVWAGFAVGSLLAIIALTTRRFDSRAIPFGPAMIAGTVLALVIYVP